MEKVEIDISIIGGGILGLFTAFEISKMFPDKQIAILEKNDYLGDETTGRNSGVLHSGIYYEKDSYKHRMCIEGNRLWREYSRELGFPVNICGKYIITPNDGVSLDELYERALNNEVPEIRKITDDEKGELSEFVHIKDGIFSPTTGIINTPEVVKMLENILFKKDVPILKKTPLVAIEKQDKFLITTENEVIESPIVINVAGLHAVAIRKMLGLTDLENYYVKGSYLRLNKKYYTESLIYPLPEKNLKGLGVHTSFDFAGVCRFGPNTEDISTIDYSLNESLIDEMYPEISKLFKGVSRTDLSLDYAGVRPKLKKDGAIYSDFFLNSESWNASGHACRYVECCGIDSPGLTASPAIARWVASAIFD